MTQEAFEEALAQGFADNGYYDLSSVVTLTKNLTISDNGYFTIDGGEIIVPDGVTLNLQGSINLYGGGRIVVQSGGTLNVVQALFIGSLGTLVVEEGGIVTENSYIEVSLPGGTIEGLDLKRVHGFAWVDSEEQLREYISKYSDVYMMIQLPISDSITLTADLSIPGTCSLSVTGGGQLIIPKDVTLTNNGCIDLSDGGEVWVQEGGTLINNGEIINTSGILTVDGSFEGNDVSDDSGTQLTSFEELKALIESGCGGEVEIYADITVTESITIPYNLTIHLVGSLTIAPGAEVISRGYIWMDEEASFIVQSGAALTNVGIISVGAGTFTVESGAEYERDAVLGTLTITYNRGSVSGISTSLYGVTCIAESESELQTYLQFSDYQSVMIHIICDVTLTSDLIIPENAEVHAGAESIVTLTVPENIVLVNKGRLDIGSNGTLIIDAGGVLNNTETGLIFNYGCFTNNGSFNNSGNLTSVISVYSFEELKAAVNANPAYTSINVYDCAEVTENLTIPEKSYVHFYCDTTVASGVTIIANGSLVIFNGSVTFAEGSALVNNFSVQVGNNSKLVMAGTYSGDGILYKSPDAEIEGIDAGYISYAAEAYNESEVRSLLEFIASEGYRKGNILWEGSTTDTEFEITSDLVIPENIYCYLTFAGTTFVVKSGATLTNYGELEVFERCSVRIEDGGNLLNGGTLTAKAGVIAGRTYVTTADALVSAVADGAEDIWVSGEISVGEDLTIPEGVSLNVDLNGKLTVDSGCSLTVEGAFTVYGTVENNGIVWNTGSAVTVNGNWYGEAASEPMSQEEFEEALAQGFADSQSYELNSIVTLTKDLTVSNNGDWACFYINRGEIIVPDGVTLDLQCYTSLYNGKIVVQSGGTLNAPNSLDIANLGALIVEEGGIVTENSYIVSNIIGGTIEGLDLKRVHGSARVESEEQLREYISKYSGVYMEIQLLITDSITLTADLNIPATCSLNIQDVDNEGQLIIPKDVTLTNDGYIYLYNDGEVWIQEGGTLINNGMIWIGDGAVSNEGTMTGNDVGSGGSSGGGDDYDDDSSRPTSFEELKALAEENYFGNVYIASDITVTEDLTIPNFMSVHIVEGGSLKVASGAELDLWNYMTIFGGVVTVEADAGIVARNGIYVENGTFIVEDGGSFKTIGEGRLIAYYMESTVIGLDKSQYTMRAEVYTEADLRSCTGLTGYKAVTVSIYGDITLTSNLTIPKEMTVDVYSATLTISKGVTLTNNGEITIEPIGAVVIEKGGKVNNTKTGSLYNFGEFTAEGTFTNSGYLWNPISVSSEEELRAAINAKPAYTGITVEGDVELTKNLTIGKDMLIQVIGNLTVPSGVTVTVNGSMMGFGYAKITFREGSKLINNGAVELNGCTLTMDGTYTHKGMLYVYRSVDGVTGIPYSKIHYVADFVDEEELKEALDFIQEKGFGSALVQFYDGTTLEITSDVTIPENVTLYVGTSGSVLLLTNGATMTNYGQVAVYYSGGISFAEGGNLLNSGVLDVDESGWIEGRTYVSTVKELYDAVDGGAGEIWVAGNVTIAKNLVIPQGVRVNVDLNGTLTVKSGYKLTINGEVNVYGTMKVSGSVAGNRINVYGGKITAKAGTYRTSGRAAETVTISGSGAMGFGMQNPLTAVVTPADAWNNGIVWSIVSGGEYASIDENGLITACAETEELEEAEITVRAEAADSAEIYAEKTVKIVKYSVAVEADKAQLVSGQSVKLTASLLPSNLTGTSVTWELRDGDGEYVTMKVKGNTATLTAKNVTEPHEIEVVAWTKDQQAKPYVYTAKVLPKAQALVIDQDGAVVTGQTVSFDIANQENLETGVTFNASVLPFDAMDGVVWSWSDTKGTYADYETNGNAITVKNFSGKTSTITLTAKSADDVVKATVKVKLVKLTQEIQLAKDSAKEIYAGKNVTFKALDGSGKAVAASAVKWSLVDPADAAYATITAAGKFTANKVNKQVDVEIQAQIVGNDKAGVLTHTVTIYPTTALMDIWGYEESVVGKTVPVNVSEEGLTLFFGASVYPRDTKQAVEWIISDTKGAYAKYAKDDLNLVVSECTGKTGTVTVTAKTGDGKKVTFTLKFGEMVTDIEVKAPTTLRSGSKAVTLTATTVPKKPTVSGVTFSLVNSSDSAYVTLTAAGKLTAKTVYECHDVWIRVSSKDGNYFEDVMVTIQPASAKQLVLRDSQGNNVTKATKVVNVDESVTLKASTLLTDADGTAVENAESVTWSVNGTKVGEGSEYTLTIKNTGSVTFTAKTEDGRTATVTVKAVTKVSSIAVYEKGGAKDAKLIVSSGKSITLAAEALPTNATSKAVTWSVAPEYAEYATINSAGKLTAKANLAWLQTIEVIATAKDGSGTVGTAEVTIVPLVRGISILDADGTELTNTTLVHDMGAEKTLDLTADAYPIFDENQNVDWSSSSPKIASVVKNNDGSATVTCLKAGTVTITATAKDGSGVKATFKLTVVKKMKDITLDERYAVAGGKSITLTPPSPTATPPTRR